MKNHIKRKHNPRAVGISGNGMDKLLATASGPAQKAPDWWQPT
jgi:hypothetical protein